MINIRSFQFITILGIFIVFTVLIYLGFFSSIDIIIFNTVNGFNVDQNILYFLVIISSFAEVINLIFVAIIFTVIRRTRKMGMILMITIVILAILVSYMKPVIAQPRPPESQKIPVLPHGFHLESDSLLTEARNFSYPSNHTAMITAFAFIVGTILQQKTKKYSYFIWVLPPMIMFSNLILGLNYVTDLIGGLLIGLVISIATSNILKLEVPFMINRFKTAQQ